MKKGGHPHIIRINIFYLVYLKVVLTLTFGVVQTIVID